MIQPKAVSTPIVKAEHVSKHYPGGIEALSNLSFSLNRGEMVFITGHSGAGKSTLLHLLRFAERISSGKLTVASIELGQLAVRSAPAFRRRIGMIFQDYRLLQDRNVFDNVALSIAFASLDSQTVTRRVRAALNQVGLLKKESSLPARLSGGEQQRVGIARAMVSRPELLLADEPTGNLDPDLSQHILGLFSRLNQLGTTTVIATHDPALLHSGVRRILSLDAGHLIANDYYAA